MKERSLTSTLTSGVFYDVVGDGEKRNGRSEVWPFGIGLCSYLKLRNRRFISRHKSSSSAVLFVFDKGKE